MPGETSIALIFTLLNEAKSLPRLLESIEAQTRKPDEVIVCDGGSSDGSLDILSAWQHSSQLSIKIIEMAGANIAAGRNAAIAACVSPVICATDGGCELDSHWLENISRPLLMKGSTLGVVYGGTIPVGDSLTGRQFSVFYEAKTKSHATETELSARSVAFLKSVWVDAGGFPEWLILAGEDTYFFRQLSKFAQSTIVEEAFVYWHHGAESLAKIFKQQARNSVSSGELHVLPPPRYLALFSLYTLVIALLTGSMWKRALAVPGAILFLATVYRDAPLLRGVKKKSTITLFLLPAIEMARDMAMIKGYISGSKLRSRARKL